MNIKAIAEKISFDWEEALEYYGGDTAMLKEKLASYEEDTDFSSLKAAVENENSDAIKKGAHKIRKASEKIALKEMAKKAEELEDSPALNETALFLELEREYTKTIKAIKEN